MTALATPVRVRKTIPPLRNGDRLARDEFERRYHAMPDNIKAELIEGVVYVSSPVRVEGHGKETFRAISWLGYYQAFTPGVEGCDNGTVRMDLDNEPQPDAMLWIASDLGGQSEIDDDGYLVGAPELSMEVSASSVGYDLGPKLKAYERNRVREYVVWCVEEAQIDWRILRESRYELVAPDAEGIYRSEILPGLWLDSKALLSCDLAAVFRTLDRAIATPEHAAFVATLKAKGAAALTRTARIDEPH